MEIGQLNWNNKLTDIEFDPTKTTYIRAPWDWSYNIQQQKLGLYKAFLVTKDGEFAIKKAKSKDNGIFIYGDVLYIADYNDRHKRPKIDINEPLQTILAKGNYIVFACRSINHITNRPQLVTRLMYEKLPHINNVRTAFSRSAPKIALTVESIDRVEKYCRTKIYRLTIIEKPKGRKLWQAYAGQRPTAEFIRDETLFKLGTKYILHFRYGKHTNIEVFIEVPRSQTLGEAWHHYIPEKAITFPIPGRSQFISPDFYIPQGTNFFKYVYENMKSLGHHEKLLAPKHMIDKDHWASKCVRKDGELLYSGKIVLNGNKTVLGKRWWRIIKSKCKLVAFV